MSARDERRHRRPRRRARPPRATRRREVARARVADRHGRVGAGAGAARPACRRCRCARPRPRARPPARPRTRRAAPCTPSGVAGTCVGRPEVELAGVHRVEAVDVLAGATARMHTRLVDAAGSGSWTRIPSTASSAFSSATSSSSSSSPVVGRQPEVAGLDADLGRGLVLQPDVDVGGGVVADEHRREPDATEPRDLVGDLGADARGERLAVHERRGHLGSEDNGDRGGSFSQSSAPAHCSSASRSAGCARSGSGSGAWANASAPTSSAQPKSRAPRATRRGSRRSSN